jgi:putative ABC transport system permease protein
MIVYIRLLKESFGFAMNALRSNKLRTFLSLLGVTIGIFSIIAVLSAVDSMRNSIESSLSGMDKNTIYLFKYSFGPTEVPRWKVNQFPNVTYDEYQYLKKNMNNMEDISFQIFMQNENLKYEATTVNSINVKPSTFEYFNIEPVKLEKGRLYTESESNSGDQVIVLGYNVAQTLFDDLDPIGKQVRVYGQRFNVIGVLKKEGQSTLGESNDISAYVPANAVRRIYGDNNKSITPVLLIKPAKGVDIEEFKAELKYKMRSLRSIKPDEIDPFFVNVLSGFTEFVDKIIGVMKIVGWAICGFSLLVGGFGIANIMFVSVKERTNLIGIQKALGAKNKFILFQFLFEAIILSLFGGVFGMLLVWLVALIVNAVSDFEFILSTGNLLLGTSIAVLIGLVSGIIPAILASKLDPVEAIRTGM